MVEITLGPKGAFSNGNVGALTRRVKVDQVVNAVPQQNRKPRPPKEARRPKIVELLRKAIEWHALIESGEVTNQAAIARQEGITRARVTQVMGLLRLAPEIQQHILDLPAIACRPSISERALRPIAQMKSAVDQVDRFHKIISPKV
jgi:hypothetical protein